MAQVADAAAAIDVVRRSIQRLCVLDHQDDPATLSAWLSNKTAENMQRWIDTHAVFVAIDGERIVGVTGVTVDGVVFLNYVAPEARLRGVSRSLLNEIETWASSRRIAPLTLESTTTAVRFYLSHGWTAMGPPQSGLGVTMRHPMRKYPISHCEER